MESIVSINGLISPLDEGVISADDRGFLFGDSIEETLVGFYNKPINVELHLKSLRQSAELVGIPIPWSNQQLSFELNSVAERVVGSKCCLRIIVSRGQSLNLWLDRQLKPNRIIYGFSNSILPPFLHSQGIKLALGLRHSINHGVNPRTCNYTQSLGRCFQGDQSGCVDTLWCNKSNEVNETTLGTIFFIGREGDFVEISSPSIYSGLTLAGSRKAAIRVLKNENILVHEVLICSTELARFDEAFLFTLDYRVVPITAIDFHQFHTTRERSIFSSVFKIFDHGLKSYLNAPDTWNK